LGDTTLIYDVGYGFETRRVPYSKLQRAFMDILSIVPSLQAIGPDTLILWAWRDAGQQAQQSEL